MTDPEVLFLQTDTMSIENVGKVLFVVKEIEELIEKLKRERD
jgi:hypothetical protein